MSNHSVPLPGVPGSEEFMRAYELALAGATAPKLEIGAARTKPGTVAAAVVSYFDSLAFKSLASETRRTWRYHLEWFRERHGDKRIAMVEKRHVTAIVDSMAATPGRARNFLKALRSLMRYAIERELRHNDPTIGVNRPRLSGAGFHTWTEEQIAAFRERHALGTPQRLALELLLNTGARRGDAVRLGRQHLKNGEFAYCSTKKGVPVDGVPLLPEAAAAIAAMPVEHLTFLTTATGKPFTVGGFGNWFREACDAAGVPKGYSAHGLRKASATRLAEAGATQDQLMAWFGWIDARTAQIYTRAANRKKLARAAGALLNKTGTSSGNPA